MDRPTANSFLLYGTTACHLCESAEAVLSEILAQGRDWQIEIIDIADDDSLLERYALTIPVFVRTDSGAELSWPFDHAKILQFAGEQGS